MKQEQAHMVQCVRCKSLLEYKIIPRNVLNIIEHTYCRNHNHLPEPHDPKAWCFVVVLSSILKDLYDFELQQNRSSKCRWNFKFVLL